MGFLSNLFGKKGPERDYVRVRKTLKAFSSSTTIVGKIKLGEALIELARNPRWVEHLNQALKDEDSGVRRAAVVELGRMRNARAIESLQEALRDEDDDVRRAATTALEGMRESATGS